MLIQFETRNFRSIRDKMVLSMLPSNDKHLADESLIDNGSKLAPRVLRSAAILGGNASGKSNLLQALEFMRSLIIESTAHFSLNHLHTTLSPFRLDAASSSAPSEFTIAVVIDDVVYEYGFTVFESRVIEEKLEVGKTAKTQKWFSRVYDKDLDKDVYVFGSNLKGKLQWLSNATGPKSLFLAIAAQGGNEMIKPLVDWFIHKLVVIRSPELIHETTLEMLANEQGRKDIRRFLFDSDIRVDDITFKPKPGLNQEPKIELVYTRNGQVIPFDLAEESIGTIKIVSLAGPIIDARRNNKVLVVDDFDASLHPLLVFEYVKAFRADPSSASSAQLVITTNRSGIINPALLRRDQIWFMNRNNDGASTMHSLVEYRVRKDADNEKGYLEGRFGGVPFVVRKI